MVDDYCSLVPGSVQTLRQIFSASPRFCCQFITSVTVLFDMSSGTSPAPLCLGAGSASCVRKRCGAQAFITRALALSGAGSQWGCFRGMSPFFPDDLIPPPDLLEMVVSWIFEDPRLILITFLNAPIATSLPIGFLELTPLSGLIRWCVKAPLAYRRKKPALANGHPGEGKLAKGPAPSEGDCQPLYSKLHLSVLQVMMLLQGHLTEKNLYGRLGLVPFDHVVGLVDELGRLSDELNPLNTSQEVELALDRLAQALQVALAAGALLCTRGQWPREPSPPLREGGAGRPAAGALSRGSTEGEGNKQAPLRAGDTAGESHWWCNGTIELEGILEAI